MKVVHVIETEGPGGAETVVRDLVMRRDRDRVQSTAVFPSGTGWLARSLPASDARYLGPTKPSRSPFDLYYLTELRRCFKALRPDVIHAHSFDGAFYSALAMRGLGARLVTTWHGLSDLNRPGWRQRLKRRIIQQAATMVYVSESLSRSDAARRASQSCVIHNGIDLDRFRPNRTDSLRREHPQVSDRILLGAVGNVRAPKAYDAMMRSIADLLEKGTPVHLFVAGDDTLHPADEVRALTKQLGINEHVTFLGFAEDVPRFLNSIDVFVLSSRSEGFSLALVQALACELPAVATRCGGPEEIIEDGLSGTLVAVDAPSEFGDAIRRIVEDRGLSERIAAAGRRRALDFFSVEAMVGKYEALYHSLR